MYCQEQLEIGPLALAPHQQQDQVYVGTLHAASCFDLTTSLWGVSFCTHFAEEETKSKKVKWLA